MNEKRPRIGIVMGSDSDWQTMREATVVCERFALPHEARVVSAHRTPREMLDYASGARERGVQVLIAGAGGAAHLPGMLASITTLPVIGVPIAVTALEGWDSLLSIVQMPAGVPVATVAVGGAHNAALLAVQILALDDAGLLGKLREYKAELAEVTHSKRLDQGL